MRYGFNSSKPNASFNKIETKKYLHIIIYTVLFLAVFSSMFVTFILKGRSFVWELDGYTQHLKTLMYIRKYYTEAITSGHLPSYDFNLGFGGNVFTTLTYYGFFDPINQLSILVPFKYTDYLYSFLVVLRVYLSGLSFIFMCRYFGKRRLYSIIGALVYISTSYVLFLGLKHPFFLNPMIYLPILIIGLDLILRKKKPYLFIFGIFLSALGGFYFLYMMTIMLFLYANVRFIDLYRNVGHKVKKYFQTLLKVSSMYLLGLSLAAVVLLPQVMAFLESNRAGKVENYFSLIDFRYFKYMLSLFYAKGGDLNLSVSPILFFTLIIAFFKYIKNNKNLLFLEFFSIIGLGLPIVGKIMNGFAYPSNRWMFGTALLLSYILVDTIGGLFEKRYRSVIIKILVVVNVLYFIFYFIGGNKYQLIGIGLVDISFLLIYYLISYIEKKCCITPKNVGVIIVTMLIVVNAGIMGFLTHSDAGYVKEFKTYGNYSAYKKSQEVYFKDSGYGPVNEFYRVDGSNFNQNQGMVAGIPNSDLYFSIINSYIGTFFEELPVANHISKFYFLGIDGRTIAGGLISNRYFVTTKKEVGEVPFGYFLKKSGSHYDIYENKYFLPFGYTYDKYITYDKMQDKFSLDKEANMLDMVYLEKKVPFIEQGHPRTYYSELSYKVELGNMVNYKANQYIDFSYDNENKVGKESIKVDSSDDFLKILYDGVKNREAYLYLESLLLNDSYTNSRIKVKSDKVSKKDMVRSKKEVNYFGRNNFLFNLGNAGMKKNRVKLSLEEKIKYPIYSIKVFSLPMDKISTKINKLKENHLQNVRFGIDEISGEISLDKPKILTMSIPYEKGWKAYVNGKEVPILRGNYMFSCLSLGRGDFNIELKYRTPGLTISIMLSVASFIILGVMLVLDWRKRKNVGISSSALL